jgi:hypothetical protein
MHGTLIKRVWDVLLLRLVEQFLLLLQQMKMPLCFREVK